MTINIEEETAVSFAFDYEKTARDVIAFVADHEGFPYEAEINLLLVDNAGIRRLNHTYRQIDSPTDVLSFPMICYPKAGDFSSLDVQEDIFNPDTGEAVLGDIVVSVDKVKEQAQSFGHSERREFAFLIVHSMLHLFGYDHMTQEEASVMEPLQQQILIELNILRDS